MALFKRSSMVSEKVTEKKSKPRRTFKGPLRWAGLLLAGIAGMTGAGYLVAHFLLFPSPMRTGEREVPLVLGLGEDDAKREIERARLAANVVTREPHPTVPAGTVIWQDPPSGVEVPRSYPVELTVSSGVPLVMVPNLRGFDPFFAQRLLLSAGLSLSAIDSVDDVAIASETVAGSSPAAGDSVPLGARILLHVTR